MVQLYTGNPSSSTVQKNRNSLEDSLTYSFPECVEQIRESLDCEEAKDLFKNPKDFCYLQNNSLTQCIIRSYCPIETDKFVECARSFGRTTVSFDKYPRGCQKIWDQLDQCLQKNYAEDVQE